MSEASSKGIDGTPPDLATRIRRVRAAERSELVGQLAGAVTHDLNNALGVVTTYSNLLMTDAEPGSQEYEDLEAIFQSARRAGELSRWLNLFSQDRSEGPPRYISLSDALRSVEKVAGKFLGSESRVVEIRPGDAGEEVGTPAAVLEDLLFGMFAETRWSLESGRVEVEAAPVADAERSRVTVRARGTLADPGPPSGLSFLAPGPGDHGDEEALSSLESLAERHAARLERRAVEGGFDLVLETSWRSGERR